MARFAYHLKRLTFPNVIGTDLEASGRSDGTWGESSYAADEDVEVPIEEVIGAALSVLGEIREPWE